ncbi:hypothetical protein CBL_09896 [Carabus blaptoides fortunei]
MMDDLMHAMQQLQKMIANQVSTSTPHHTLHEHTNIQSNIDGTNTINVKKPKQQSQAATLLQQVQRAMEATVAQLSTSGRILKPDGNDACASDNKMATHEQLSISEKWRLYTELVQIKNECTTEYCVAKMRLGQELGLSFNETKREMLIGLWSYRLCTVLFLRKHNDEADILSDIDEWERIEKARSEVFKKYRNKNYKYN